MGFWKRLFGRKEREAPAAFAEGQGGPVRDAGPDAMRDGAHRPWLKEDEQSDESFPASDPPANY